MWHRLHWTRSKKKALRFIFNSYGRHVSITNLRHLSELPTLESRRKLHRLQMLYNIVNGNIRMGFTDYMQYNSARPTRWKHSKTIVRPRVKTKVYQFSFFPRTIAEWNELPCDIVGLSSVHAFTNAVQDYLWCYAQFLSFFLFYSLKCMRVTIYFAVFFCWRKLSFGSHAYLVRWPFHSCSEMLYASFGCSITRSCMCYCSCVIPQCIIANAVGLVFYVRVLSSHSAACVVIIRHMCICSVFLSFFYFGCRLKRCNV